MPILTPKPKPDETLTLTELAVRLRAPKSTAKNWVRAGMPILVLGRGRGRPTRLSLKKACRWLAERDAFVNDVFALTAMFEYQRRAQAILRRLK